jgi:hypothetical protein
LVSEDDPTSSTPGNGRRRSCVKERPLHLSELPSLYFPRSNPYFQSPIHNGEATTSRSHQRRGNPSPRYTCINPPPTCKGSRECSFHPYCSKGLPQAQSWGREDICNTGVATRLERSMRTLLRDFIACTRAIIGTVTPKLAEVGVYKAPVPYFFKQRTRKEDAAARKTGVG